MKTKNHTPFLFISLVFLIQLFISSCGPKKTSTETDYSLIKFSHEDSLKAPVFQFTEATYDFGTIQEGGIIRHRFNFKNMGKSPLMITNIQTSCGCTTPNFNPKPLASQDTGSFTIQFNSSGKAGPQTKIITIFANTIPRTHKVALVGIVNHH
jgi:Protein of unknown function (DUF1573)